MQGNEIQERMTDREYAQAVTNDWLEAQMIICQSYELIISKQIDKASNLLEKYLRECHYQSETVDFFLDSNE